MQAPTITVVGYLGAPPRARRTANGVAVTDFRIANTPSRRDASGAWSDRETMWFSVTAWRSLAEHCAASLRTGDRVVVTGRLGLAAWKTEEGEPRSGWEVDATTVGLELTRWTATAQRPLHRAPDRWVSSGQVDPVTGEVLVERLSGPEDGPGPDPDDDLDALEELRDREVLAEAV